MLKNKCCLYVIISIRFFSITICNLLIESSSYISSRVCCCWTCVCNYSPLPLLFLLMCFLGCVLVQGFSHHLLTGDLGSAFTVTWTQLGIKCYFWLELDIVQLQFVQWRIAEGLIHMMGTLCVGLESELTWLVNQEDGETFYYQLMHIMLKNTELLKNSKITLQHVSVYIETIFRELQSVLG